MVHRAGWAEDVLIKIHKFFSHPDSALGEMCAACWLVVGKKEKNSRINKSNILFRSQFSIPVMPWKRYFYLQLRISTNKFPVFRG